MEITCASAMGACFGVVDAIDMALGFDQKENLTILGQLVHNPQVLERLNQAGIRMVDNLESKVETKYVMITAHGVADKVKQHLEREGHIVIDASCPLVVKVHRTIKKLVKEGYFPVVVGQKNHVEVKGIVGDIDHHKVINQLDEVEQIKKYPRIGVVSQTTQQLQHVKEIVRAIESQGHEEVKFVDTVCVPTKKRQSAIHELVYRADVVVVIGGKNSSNTKKLQKVCIDNGVEAFHIQSYTDICQEWFKGKSHIGITAGTSTPIDVIEKVYRHLCQMFNVSVKDLEVFVSQKGIKK